MAKNVFVGLSGGVDSAVSAYLLKKAGYNVTGVFIKVWQPDFIPCTWREDRLDAMRVAAHIGIPFKTLDLEDVYKKEVIDYMISEYKLGRTPNPDVFCNKEVKFGGFLKWAIDNGADFVATGHYARTITDKQLSMNNRKLIVQNEQEVSKSYLCRGIDDSKDQSYFLWTLTQEQLSKCIFPIGEMHKKDVRKLAEKIGLPNAIKKDSQGLCFVSNVNMKDFLKHFIELNRGNVISQSGEIIGEHDGAVFYTIGERHGFQITKKSGADNGPYFVIDKDLNKNTITVSEKKSENTGSKKYEFKSANWISGEASNSVTNITANSVYHGTNHSCRIEGNTVIFDNEIMIAPGQSIVFYNNDICLGGAIAEKSL